MSARAGSIRGAVITLAVGVLALAVVTVALACWRAVDDATRDALDRALGSRARALAALVEYDGAFEMEPSGEQGFRVTAPDGAVLGAQGTIAGAPAGRLDAPAIGDGSLDGAPARVLQVLLEPRVEGGVCPGPVAITLAAPTAPRDATLAEVSAWLWGVGALAIGLGALLAWWLGARALAPLARVDAALTSIDERHLGVRLPADGQPRELARVVDTLNRLLARLESSFERERHFTADVSHELRTPLAGLCALIEVTRLAPRDGDDYRAALDEALAIARHLSGLVESLLALARYDAGAVPSARESFALAPLVEERWQPLAARAAAKNLTFRCEVPPETRVASDRAKLALILDNLLANAVDYTAAAGWIAVLVPPGGVVEVVDSGPPIPEDQLPLLFDRFWRADAARSVGHTGLGLAIVRAVASHLGLEVHVRNLPEGGVSFRVAPM